MAEASEKSAVSGARSILRFDDNVPARAWFVKRLDHPNKFYYLVVFGQENASIGIAVVDSATGEVNNSARLPGTNAHLIISAQQALSLVGKKTEAILDLVWKPCPATRSPFYPLWRIRMETGTLYLDQHGNLLNDIS